MRAIQLDAVKARKEKRQAWKAKAKEVVKATRKYKTRRSNMETDSVLVINGWRIVLGKNEIRIER